MSFKKETISNVITSTNIIDDFKIHNQTLADCTILLFDKKVNSMNSILMQKSFGNYKINPLADFEKLAVLNQFAFQKEAAYKMQHTIELDLNIMSYIRKLFFFQEIDNDLIELLLFLNNNKLNISCSPYLIECGKNKHSLDTEKVYETLLAFSAFSSQKIGTFNIKDFNKNLLSSSNYIHADELFKTMKNLKNENKQYKQFEAIYLMFLKTFVLKFSSKKSAKNKFLSLLEFVNTELFVYLENELLLCYWWLNNDDKTSDFFKIMPNSKDIINKIQAMAWDVFNIRLLEIKISQNTHKNEISLYSIASTDGGYNKILRLNPILRIGIFGKESNEYILYREQNIFDVCTEINTLKILNRYQEKRVSNIVSVDYKNTILSLENDVNSLGNK